MKNPCVRGFPITEFEDRFRRIQASMRTHNIDAILITTESNFHYFSGLVSQFWVSPTRPIYLILPAVGPTPIAIVSDIMLRAIHDTWIQEVYSWSAPCLTDDGVSLLIEVLTRFEHIGIPMNIESELRMPLKHLVDISTRLQKEFLDVTPLISNLRNVKSVAEIQKIEAICQIASTCFERLSPRLEQTRAYHLTERMVVKEMHQLLLEEGADQVKYIVGKSGQGGYDSIVDGPTDRILQPGDIFVIDTGAVYDNYFCDFDRNFIIQDDSESHDSTYLEEMNRILWYATEHALAVAKPQNTFSDIWDAILSYYESMGVSTEGYGGRMGHCLGLQLTELPSITAGESTLLQERMVLSIEPFLQLNNGKVLVHEECVVLTHDGCRLLTKRAPLRPFTLKVRVTFDPDGVEIVPALPKKHALSSETTQVLQEFTDKLPLCKAFHQSLDPTPSPLLTLTRFGLTPREVLVKDEGTRFGLQSFKGLGSSFAIHLLPTKGTLCTMTDGNHGRGVAYAAQQLGLPCVVYVPQTMTRARQDAIRNLGAHVIVVPGSYDDAIAEVRRQAHENDWCLVSDTSWEGYTQIPTDIMIGYSTIFREIEDQRVGHAPITHVVVQAGVGGLASCAALWLELRKSQCSCWDDHVQLLIVEPLDADCIATNVRHQQNHPEHKDLIPCPGSTNSLMAGLNCGMPSYVSWPLIRDIASFYITLGDQWAKRAMVRLHQDHIVSGESGAAGLAGVLAAPSLFEEESVVLTINTESDTDPEAYRRILQENLSCL